MSNLHRNLDKITTPLWVFGYGSLMWEPGFEPSETRVMRVNGWHRRFSLLSKQSWGTAERPGLSAALHPGGSTLGLALRIRAHEHSEVMAYLNTRERAYRQVQVSGWDENGRLLEAITYVANPESGLFLDTQNHETLAPYILQGDGQKGTSLFYLRKTVDHLSLLQCSETHAHRLLEFVEGWRVKPAVHIRPPIKKS